MHNYFTDTSNYVLPLQLLNMKTHELLYLLIDVTTHH